MSERRALLVGIKDYRHFANLQGCHNDVEAMAHVLRSEKYGFTDVTAIHHDHEDGKDPGRDDILSAMEDLLKRTGEDDVVVFFYSGHGAFLKDPETGERYESIVPHDSGRGAAENRDVFDKEIDLWARRLNDKTPHITLLFDSCHSGGVTRDADDDIRQVAGDVNPRAELLARLRDLTAKLRDPAHPLAARSPYANLGSDEDWIRWTSRPPRRVTMTACQAFELAGERHEDPFKMIEGFTPPDKSFLSATFGAFTFFLHRSLAALGEGDERVRFRDLLGRVAAGIREKRQHQHPRLLGDADLPVFGLEALPRTPYLRVLAVDGDGVTLSGGAAHGVRPQSLWQIRTADAEHRGGGREVAAVRVEEVGTTTSVARLATGAGVEGDQRAFLLEQPVPASRLAVALGVDEEEKRLRSALAGRPLLRPATPEERDVLIRVRDAGERLGATVLRERTWTAVDAHGALAVRSRPVGAGGVEKLLDDLESVARYQALLALDAPPESVLNGKVELVAGPLRTEGEFEKTAEEGGVVFFEEGAPAEFLITNRHDEDVFLNLIQLDSDFSIERKVPARDHQVQEVRLAPGASLRLPRDYFRNARSYEQTVPDGFPWWIGEADAPEDVSFYTLRLFVTLEPADFSFLEQQAARTASGHPLSDLVAHGFLGPSRDAEGASQEAAPAQPWTVVDLHLGVRRPRTGGKP